MSLPGRVLARLRGDTLRHVQEQLASQREIVLAMNHSITQMSSAVAETHQMMLALNHDVRSGSEVALPLFLGYVERLRVDAETAIAATDVIERHLARIEALSDERNA
jgi:hypothetical protein